MKKWAFLLLFVHSFTLRAQPASIPFIATPPRIDGLNDDWKTIEPYSHQNTRFRVSSPNRFQSQFGYDDSYLYAFITVFDKHLIRLATVENGSSRLHFNDAVELFLDAHNNSGNQMDSDDFQILIDVAGKSTIFRGGDRFLKEIEKALVPKDTITQNFVLDAVVKTIGTINDSHDLDSLYTIELRIPWAALGVKSTEHYALKIDVCNDDADSLLDILPLPDSAMIPNYGFENWKGQTDFSFPAAWQKMTLSKSQKTSDNYLLFSVIGLIILAGGWWTLRYFNQPKSVAFSVTELTSKPVILHALIAKAEIYINQNLEKDLSPTELASELAVSQRQLQRLFREELNTTPNAYINQQKMAAAHRLLQTGSHSISEIAYTLGFSDPAYFARVFKKQFGINPREVQ